MPAWRSRRAAARSAGWRRCGRSGGRRRSGCGARRPRRACPRGCARAGGGPPACGRPSASISPSASGRVTSTCEPQPRKLRETLRSAVVTSSGMPLRSITSTANSSSSSASSSKSASRSAATPSAATSAPECSTRISTRPMWSMCWWVITIRLEVVDRVAALVQAAGQFVERLAGVGAGVDQGQRLVLDQVGVDRADRERGRDRDPVDAGERRLLERLLGGHARTPHSLTSGSAPAARRGGAPCPRARAATRG